MSYKRILGFMVVGFSLISTYAFPNNDHVKIVKTDKNEVHIGNNQVRFEFSLSKGNFQIIDVVQNKKCLSDGRMQVQDIYNTIESDEKCIHSYVEERINDELGNGAKIIIKSSREGYPVLILEVSIYTDKSFIVFNAGVENTTSYQFRLCRIAPIVANAFEGFEIDENFISLDGNAGGIETRIRKDLSLECWNNFLVHFGNNISQRNLVMGGLTYHDFEKYTKFIKTDKKLHVEVYSKDPIGRLIEVGTTYMPDDKYYLDFMAADPFTALENYGFALRDAQKIKLPIYYFPTLCLWYSGMDEYGGGPANNDSPGAVKEMEDVVKSGFLKYSTVAIRLVPDNYEKDNQQGWWDDEHWQKYPNGAGSFGPCYKSPYETTVKWGQKIRQLGGIPLMYCQTARRSEDYCIAHPEHILFNDPNRFTNVKEWWHHRDDYPAQVSYDFTDLGFLNHLKEVYLNLKAGNIGGLMFDYPITGWNAEGGFEDKYATTAYAYRNIFVVPHQILGNSSYLHERNITRGSDVTLGAVASQRVMGDTDKMNPSMISRSGLRWYKNRVVINYDSDAKNPFHTDPSNIDGVNAMFTMCYVATGRLLLGVSFSKLTDQHKFALSRTIPYHSNPQSARPIDAFTGSKYPQVYDFKVNNDWHQITLYNTLLEGGEWPDDWSEIKKGLKYELTPSLIKVPLGAVSICSGLNLIKSERYYIYDFWNNLFVGNFKGSDTLIQILRPGEARMLSVHKKESFPQFLSTNRHIMQGYVDMIGYPEWNHTKKTLVGMSNVVSNEPYKIVIALNGYEAKVVNAENAQCGIKIIDKKLGLIEVIIEAEQNSAIKWSLICK